MNKINKLLVGFTVNLPFILVVLGLASFVFAGFLFNQIIGYVILGAALILLAWILAPNPDLKGVNKR